MNKIEQVAKAIGDHIYGYVDKTDTPHTWEKCIAIAKIAIVALREPTEEMIYEFCNANNQKEAWNNAIDAALKE